MTIPHPLYGLVQPDTHISKEKLVTFKGLNRVDIYALPTARTTPCRESRSTGLPAGSNSFHRSFTPIPYNQPSKDDLSPKIKDDSTTFNKDDLSSLSTTCVSRVFIASQAHQANPQLSHGVKKQASAEPPRQTESVGDKSSSSHRHSEEELHGTVGYCSLKTNASRCMQIVALLGYLLTALYM